MLSRHVASAYETVIIRDYEKTFIAAIVTTYHTQYLNIITPLWLISKAMILCFKRVTAKTATDKI